MAGLGWALGTQDPSRLEAVGFVAHRDEEGPYWTPETELVHDSDQADSPKWQLDAPDDTSSVTYSIKFVAGDESAGAGSGTCHQRVGPTEKYKLTFAVAPAELATLMQSGSSVKVQCEARLSRDGRLLNTLFAGSFIVPERRYALGSPSGPPGFMVALAGGDFVYVFGGGRVTLISSLDRHLTAE